MRKSFVLLVCMIMACLLIPCNVLAAERGDTVNVAIKLDNGKNVTGVFLHVYYDTDMVECISAEVAELFAFEEVDKDTLGEVHYTGVSLKAINKSGTLCNITFRVKADSPEGKAIKVQVFDAYDGDFDSIDVSVSFNQITVEALKCTNHSWNSGKVISKATCAKTGVKKYTCTVCGATEEKTIPVTDEHVQGKAMTTKIATCEFEGEKVIPCSVCGKVLSTIVVPTLEHEDGDTVVTKKATCTEAGKQVTQCMICGKTVKSEAIPAKGHSWDGGVMIKEPTALEDGVRLFTCTSCGATKTESIPSYVMPRVPGDADDSGTVDLADALVIMQYDAGWNVNINESNAEVDGNGTINIFDALLILQYNAGWTVTLK